MKLKWLISIGMVFLVFLSQAQNSTDNQLANLYYNNGEFEKALSYFEKIIGKQSSKFELLRYVECLEKTNHLKEADKVWKRICNQFSTDLELPIMMGEYFGRTNRLEDQSKLYNDIIKNSTSNGYAVVELFELFKDRGNIPMAGKALELGRKNLKKSYPLNLQFAEYYGLTANLDKMLEEYFELLEMSPEYLEPIEALLSRQIDFSEEESPIYLKIKEQLLLKIQKKPNDFVYSDMLIWLYVQRKSFSAALVQAQALDKREKGQGYRVMELAKTCVENSAYAVARNGFNYVISIGEISPYYYEAMSSLLNVRFREITFEKRATQEDIKNAIGEYRDIIKRLGWGRSSINVAKELSTIMAYYGNDVVGAKNLLDSCLALPGLTDMQQAEIKMNLADILVLGDDIWESSLLYMQVDKMFKFEPIGAEAKFKNARIFYYDGDFLFAQSQLDVLKQSTSKLIANDAMKLSILITDNLGLDSNYSAMNWFSKADLLLEQHKYDEAFVYYDSIIKGFPASGLGDELLLRKAQAMKQQGKWQEATIYLEQIVSNWGQDILADDALFQLGELYELHLNDKTKAAEYYKKIIFDYKGSLLTVEARKRFRALRGDNTTDEEI